MTSVDKETPSLSSLFWLFSVLFIAMNISYSQRLKHLKPNLLILYQQKALSCFCLHGFLAWVLLSGQDLMELAAHGSGWNADQAGLGLLILLLLLSNCWAHQCVPPTPCTCLILKDKYCDHFNDLPFLTSSLVPSPFTSSDCQNTWHHTTQEVMVWPMSWQKKKLLVPGSSLRGECSLRPYWVKISAPLNP